MHLPFKEVSFVFSKLYFKKKKKAYKGSIEANKSHRSIILSFPNNSHGCIKVA